MIFGYEFNIFFAACCIICGYLIGNIQTAIIISKRFFHDDIREHGSGNAGSTNMLRVYGLKPGALTFLGDCAKGILGILIGRMFMGTLGGYIAALSVVIGHCYPAFAGFRGGKGVASTFGIIWMSFPLGAAIATAVVVVVFLIKKRISLCSLIGIAVFLAATLVFEFYNTPLCLLAAALLAIIYLRHWDNIQRLLHGEEKPIINS